MVRLLMIMVPVFHCRSDVRSSQDREDERLEESHQQLDQVHKCRKQATNHCTSRCTTCTFAVVAKEENEADKAENDDVSCRYVGKQSNHQGERLDEQAEDFNRRQDQLYPGRNAGHPEDVLPVVFVAVDVGNDERQHGKRQGHRQVAGNVGASGENRNQAEQVAEKDEKEQAHDERLEALVVLFANHRACYFVADKHEEHLKKRLDAVRRLAVVPAVAFCHQHENDDQQQGRQQHRHHIFGDGKIVERSDATAEDAAIECRWLIEFVFFALVYSVVNIRFFLLAAHVDHFLVVNNAVDVHFTSREAWVSNAVHTAVVQHVAVDRFMTVIEDRRGKNRPAAVIGGINKTREGEVNIFPDMEFIGVSNVVHHRAYRIVGTCVVTFHMVIMCMIIFVAVTIMLSINGKRSRGSQREKQNKISQVYRLHKSVL